MAELQFYNYISKVDNKFGYLDASNIVAQDFNDLKSKSKNLFKGQEAICYFNGKPVRLIQNVDSGFNRYTWRILAYPIFDSIEERDEFVLTVSSILKNSSYATQAFEVGDEVTVRVNEDIFKYVISYIDILADKNVAITWKEVRFDSKSIARKSASEVVKDLNDGKTSNVIYTLENVYSYIDGESVKQWTDDIEDIPGEYADSIVEYENGLYAVVANEDGSVSLINIITDKIINCGTWDIDKQ